MPCDEAELSTAASGCLDGCEVLGQTGHVRARRVVVLGRGPELRLGLSGDWEREPLAALEDAVRLSSAVEKLQRELVARARTAGSSWTAIGRALGTTKQAAWGRFSDTG